MGRYRYDLIFVSFFLCFCFLFFAYIYNGFGCASILNMCVSFGVDVGPVHPEGKPRHMWRARVPDAGESERVLRQVERHLNRLTFAIPMAEIEDLPVAYQRQVTGVPRNWIHLFRCVAQATLCYREVHGEASGDAP